MSRACDLCSKGSQKGNRITLIWGVKYRSILHREPNLRDTTIFIDNKPVKVRVCTTCLKNIKGGKYQNVQSYTQAYTNRTAEAAKTAAVA
jgi:ribosomal protein L28